MEVGTQFEVEEAGVELEASVIEDTVDEASVLVNDVDESVDVGISLVVEVEGELSVDIELVLVSIALDELVSVEEAAEVVDEEKGSLLHFPKTAWQPLPQ